MSEVRVYIRHVRSQKLCLSGVRAWGKQHGFDFNQFVREGYPVEQVEATGDHFAMQIARAARAEFEGKVKWQP